MTTSAGAGESRGTVDAARFKRLFEEVNPGLLRLLVLGWGGPNGQRLFVESLTEAEDVAAEAWRVFVEHYRSGRFERDRPVAPYVEAIAKNVALGRIRRLYTQRDKTQSLSWFFELNAESNVAFDAALERAIQQLDEPEKTILRGKQDGLPEHEIGDRLGFSRDQVRRRYVKALRDLRRSFIEEGLVSESFDSLEVAR